MLFGSKKSEKNPGGRYHSPLHTKKFSNFFIVTNFIKINTEKPYLMLGTVRDEYEGNIRARHLHLMPKEGSIQNFWN